MQVQIDPEILYSPSVRRMPTLYKMFWMYLLTRCDSAGIWIVDWEIASTICGGEIDPKTAEQYFLTVADPSDPENKPKAVAIHGGKRWFVRAYIFYQYRKGILNESNWAKSIQSKLLKNGIDPETLELINPSMKGSPNPSMNPSQRNEEGYRKGKDIYSIESSDPNETTTIVNRGVKGGNGIVKHQPDDTPVTTQFYIAFVTAYGQFGRPVKRGSIEQELHTALLNCIGQNPKWDFEAARSFLLMQAGRACDSDIANDNKTRLNPDSWLRDRCYETPIDTSPPKRGPTQEEEIQRLIDLQERNSQNGR